MQNSYRRIGRTCYLAYGTSDEHPSRFIAIGEDVPNQVELFYTSGQERCNSPIVIQCGLHCAPVHLDEIRSKRFTGPPLHKAAYDADLTAVRAFLTLPLDASTRTQLLSRDNEKGLTPLELCEQRQRQLREWDEARRVWRGYHPNALQVIYLLKHATGEDVGMSEDQFVTQNRYGCTCEQCTDGWLSPRMRYALLCMYYSTQHPSQPDIASR